MRINKLAPWEIYYNEINAFFKHDPDVNVHYDSDKQEIRVFVNDEGKAAALETMLIGRQVFGNVELTINVIPSNDEFKEFKEMEIKDTLEAGLYGNEAVKEIRHISGIFDATYVVFRRSVLQYYSDDIGSLYGKTSTLYEDVARNIFNPLLRVFYCTE